MLLVPLVGTALGARRVSSELTEGGRNLAFPLPLRICELRWTEDRVVPSPLIYRWRT